LWRSIDTLLGRGHVPLASDISADQFDRHFDDIKSIPASGPRQQAHHHCRIAPLLVRFPTVPTGECSVQEVAALIRELPDKSCCLDPLPTAQLKAVDDVVAPFLTELFNRSLSTGSVPEMFKEAYILPRLKNSYMDPSDARSYRPISNLPVVSKLLERIVAKQLLTYLDTSQLQSAYRPRNSTETAVTKVLSDVLSAIDNGSVAALVLLDLSAAFDTVDHEILLRRLESFNIVGCNIRWFKSYLVSRRQFVCTSSSSSSPTVIFSLFHF